MWVSRMRLTREDVDKVRMPFRIISGICAGCIAVALGIIIYVLLYKKFDIIGLFFLFIAGGSLHITFTVAKSGFPPKYLLWTSTKKAGPTS